MRFFTLMLLLMASTASTAFAAELVGSIVVESTQSNTITSFQPTDDPAQYKYAAQRASGTFRARMYGTGAFASLDETDNGYLTEVPGVNAEGHFFVTLSKRKRNYSFIVDVESHTAVANKPLTVNTDYALPVNIYDGNWRKFENGDIIFLEPTEEAKQVYLNALLEDTDHIFSPIKEGLEAKGLTVSEMIVEEVKFNGRTNITASLKEVNFYVAPLNYKIRYDIYR